MKLVNRHVCALILLSSLILLFGFVQGATESLSIQGGSELVQTIDLLAEDRITVTFTAIGEAPSTLHFWLAFANGTTRDYGELSHAAISFVSDVKGECDLHFDNSDSSSIRLVTLNYEIEHYYFGLPQLLFILLVIAVLLVCVAAGYFIMGKYG
jgi:hypothetical protein